MSGLKLIMVISNAADLEVQLFRLMSRSSAPEPAADPGEPPTAPPRSEPVNWPAATVVIAFLAAGVVLFALGRSAEAVIGLLGGAGAVGIEVVRRMRGAS